MKKIISQIKLFDKLGMYYLDNFISFIAILFDLKLYCLEARNTGFNLGWFNS